MLSPPNIRSTLEKALTCQTLKLEELRFMHALHLRLLADPVAVVTDEEAERIQQILFDQNLREWLGINVD